MLVAFEKIIVGARVGLPMSGDSLEYNMLVLLLVPITTNP